MHNLVRVAVGNAGQELLHEHGSITLSELSAVNDLVEKLTTLNMVSHDVEALVILEVLVDLDDVGVVEVTKCLNLVEHGLLLGLVHGLLLEKLDSTLFLGLTVGAETDLTEGTLSENLTNLVDITESTFSLSDEHLRANFDFGFIIHHLL